MATEARTPVESIDEALRILARVSSAVRDDEHLRLLQEAMAWLEIAKYRINQTRAHPQRSP
jgi:hypothetical protein